jgi:hypothetical protein
MVARSRKGKLHGTRGTAVVSTGVMKNRTEVTADPTLYGRYIFTSEDTDILRVTSAYSPESRLPFP